MARILPALEFRSYSHSRRRWNVPKTTRVATLSQVSQLYLHTPSCMRRPHSPSHFSPSLLGVPLRANVRVWPAAHVGEGGPSRSPVSSPVHGMQMSTSQFVPQQLRRSSPLGMFLWHGPLHRMGSAVSAPLDRWRKWPMVHLGRSHRRVDGHDGAVGRVSPSCVSGLWETFFAAWMATFVAACEARLLRPTAADLAALAAPTAEPPERPDPASRNFSGRLPQRV